jgi:hypothetical protein
MITIRVVSCSVKNIVSAYFVRSIVLARCVSFADGGYPTCYSFLNPNLLNYDYHTVVWGEWLESVRKDEERLFGTLKSRFRWLSSSIQYHNHVTIHNAVRICAILHNRLLEYDNMLDFDWGDIDPNTAVDDLIDTFLASRIMPPEPDSIKISRSLARNLLAVLSL